MKNKDLEKIKKINIEIDGKMKEFIILSNKEIEKHTYIAAQPIDSDDFIAFEIEFLKDGEFDIKEIEDDEVYERVMDDFEDELNEDEMDLYGYNDDDDYDDDDSDDEEYDDFDE